MRKFTILGFGLATALVAALGLGSPASATTYLFHFQGDPTNTDYGNVVINGTYTLSGNAPGPIVTVTGTVSGGNQANVIDGAITNLSPYAASDNILYNTGAIGDYSFGGVSFDVSKTVNSVTTTVSYNLFDWAPAGTPEVFLLVSSVNATGFPQYSTPTGPGGGATPPASVGLVPEPTTWALLLSGFGMIGGALRTAGRRRIAARV